jgi:glycerol-3-phosphate dehydrogenase
VTDLRSEQIGQLRAGGLLDVLVIGGGINGAGVIRDLALRAEYSGTPLRVALVEQKHFASGTSGKNSQLIHGGLRYLKYLQIHLVRESLHERALLMKLAPQFVTPLGFLLPMYGFKSRLVYESGLWLYDRLAGSEAIAPHRMVSPSELAEMEPGLARNQLSAAALFYDCAIPSARFVVENVLDAVAHGAMAANYVHADQWKRSGTDGHWRVRCTDTLSGEQFEIQARKLVDARGAWSNPDSLRLVRGSHIVIPRVNSSDHAIAHFEPDGRVVFVIPWGSRNQLTLVGTTDEDQQEGPDHVRISSEETRYLLGIVHKLFPQRGDVTPVSWFSSLRPLVRATGSATRASRDHRIWNSSDGVLHIAGGKYTTYRLMSQEAGDLACREIAPQLEAVHRTAETPFGPVEREIGDQLEQHLGDYLYVSTYLGYEQRWDCESLLPLARALAAKRGWDESRVDAEVNAIIEASGESGRSAAW